MAETETPVKEAPAEEEAPAVEAPTEETSVEEEAPTEQAPVKEAPAEEAKTEEAPKKPDKKSSKKKALILLLLLLLAIGIAIAVYFLFFKKDDGRIPYAEGVVLFGDEEIEPVDRGWVKLTYNYVAKSRDGVNFTCLLTNDPANRYDLYFDIYADDAFQDQVFLSGLIRPGYALTEIMLNHALPAGTTSCYVVFNQVTTDEDGNQSIVNQMMVTVDFVVE